MLNIKSTTPLSALTKVGAISRDASAARLATAACLKEFFL
jgi:hypothetical protein